MLVQLYRFSLLLGLFMMSFTSSFAQQQVTFSEVEKEDIRRLNFEIIGRVGGNYLVFKNNKSENYLEVMDGQMKRKAKAPIEFLPPKIINVDFVNYNDHVWMIFQHQRKNVVFCSAAKFDGEGKILAGPIDLDTTQTNSNVNKIYTLQVSENKQQILLFKINNRDDGLFRFTTFLYNDKMELLRYSKANVPVKERREFLGEFAIDNSGNLYCAKQSGTENYINKLTIIKKTPEADSFTEMPIDIGGRYLEDVHIKADNTNKRLMLNGFYYKQQRGNIEGLFTTAVSFDGLQKIYSQLYAFGESLREEVRASGSTKTVFNDHFIRNINIRKDGGFLLTSESIYTTSRGNTFNRWDMMYNSPFMSPLDWYAFGGNPYYWNYWGNFYNPWGFSPWQNNQSVRYHADNAVIFSFDPAGKLEWTNVIRKEQFDDNNEGVISFFQANTGKELHFLFNQVERRNLVLSNQSIAASGQINRYPAMKKMDQGYEFMPRYGKQVGARIIIVPCLIRNYICFAKIEL